MRWSFRVARVAGTDIRIHLTFLLLLAWVAVAALATGGAAAAWRTLAFVVLLFASVLLHELGHATAARRYGIATPDITLLPIGGVARLQRIPREPGQELVIALAGPLVTAVLAVAFTLLTQLSGRTGGVPTLDDPHAGIAARLAVANAALLVFNLLPAFPMDGGRVLRALLAMRMDYLRATRVAASVGQAFAFLFLLVGVFGTPILLLIAFFVYVGGRQEAALTEIQGIAARLPASAAMVTAHRPLHAGDTLAHAVDALLATSQRDFVVVDGAGRLLGVLTQRRLIEALRRGGAEQPVTAVMEPAPPPVAVDAPLDAAFERLMESRAPLLPVIEPDGRVAGLITAENVGELVMVQTALARGGGREPARDAGQAQLRWAARSAP